MSTVIEETQVAEHAVENETGVDYAIVADPELKAALLAQRQEAGSDRWDEVWKGVYILMPLPNDEYQDIVGELLYVLKAVVQRKGLGLVRPGVNVSDRIQDWESNYRCPDVVVFLNDTKAENHDTFWYGGPDFAVEVVSPHDRSHEKFAFYASVGTRELLLIDREPWSLELFRLSEGALNSVSRSTAESGTELRSETVPLSFALKAAEGRPRIEIRHHDGQQAWTV
jgi:Uma2 family endonuclease